MSLFKDIKDDKDDDAMFTLVGMSFVVGLAILGILALLIYAPQIFFGLLILLIILSIGTLIGYGVINFFHKKFSKRRINTK